MDWSGTECGPSEGDCGTQRPESDGGKSPVDGILKSLAHPTRRFVLYYLQDHEIATRDELAREAAARRSDTSPDGVSAEEVARMKTSLTHNHLPELAAIHLIEYDPRSETVRYSDPPVLLEMVLRLLAQFETGGLG